MVLQSSGTIHGAFIAYRLKVMTTDPVLHWLLVSLRIRGAINVTRQFYVCNYPEDQHLQTELCQEHIN